MSYKICITAAAQRDMANASDHIDFVLKNPKAAENLLDEAEVSLLFFRKNLLWWRILSLPPGEFDVSR